MKVCHEFFNEDEELYHSFSKSGQAMSSHFLAKFMKSPFRYKNEIDNPKDDDNIAFAFGRAAHKMILEGEDEYLRSYVVSDGPLNPKTNKPYGKTTEKYLNWYSAQSKNVISTEDDNEIRFMNLHVLCHRESSKLLSNPNRKPELVARVEIDGVVCQIRIDTLCPKNGIVDLKTCREIERFEYDIKDFGYLYQMAFYQMVAKEITGTDIPVSVIAVDKTPEHLVGVWKFPQSELDIAKASIVKALARYRECKETGNFPTGWEECRTYTSKYR